MAKTIWNRAIFALWAFRNPQPYMEIVPQNDNDLRVIFGGEEHEIDSATLVASLLTLSKLIEDANARLNPEDHVRVRIRATKGGSFECDIALLVTTALANYFFKGDTVKKVKDIKDFIVSVFKLKKILGGEAPKTITQTGNGNLVVQGNKGDLTINQYVLPVYEENKESLAALFRRIDADSSVTDFQLADKKSGKLFLAEKSEFDEMGTVADAIEDENRIVNEPSARLLVRRPSLEGAKSWEFTYKRRAITAKIEDEEFLKRVKQGGERFGHGDSLFAELQINQHVSPQGIVTDTGYIVRRVHSHKTADEDLSAGLPLGGDGNDALA